MSYLTTPELKSFNKAVISFWFRVPKASMDAAQKEHDAFYAADNPGDPPPFLGLVPLVVFGKEGTSPTTSDEHGSSESVPLSTTVTMCVEQASDSYDGVTLTMTAWEECADPYTEESAYLKTTWTHSPKPGKPLEPSYIAIDGNGYIQCRFESTKTGTVTLASVITSFTGAYTEQAAVNQCFTFQIVGYCGDYENTVTDPTGGTTVCGLLLLILALIGWRLATAVPDFLVDQGSSERIDHEAEWGYGSGVGDMGTGALSFGPSKIFDADTWHHVLVSVDMTGGSASVGRAVGDDGSDLASHISATSTAYIAVDDVNYPTGSYPFDGTNKVYTAGAAIVANLSQGIDYNDEGGETAVGPVPSYSLTDMSVPAAEVGIPSTGKYVDHIRKVEMAEFQLFTGATLDTSEEDNRRLFITGKDKNGAQFPTNSSPLTLPYRKFAIGDPAKWEPGADNPAYAPPLFDPSGVPTQVDLTHTKKLVTADIDFTKCAFNWMMGLNLGKTEGKVKVTGKIKAYWPPDGSDPMLKSSTGAEGEG